VRPSFFLTLASCICGLHPNYCIFSLIWMRLMLYAVCPNFIKSTPALSVLYALRRAPNFYEIHPRTMLKVTIQNPDKNGILIPTILLSDYCTGNRMVQPFHNCRLFFWKSNDSGIWIFSYRIPTVSLTIISPPPPCKINYDLASIPCISCPPQSYYTRDIIKITLQTIVSIYLSKNASFK
jgi:hypothetical protein